MERQVWDLLGLPSCGKVYCAGDVDENKEGAEVGIVVWTSESTRVAV